MNDYLFNWVEPLMWKVQPTKQNSDKQHNQRYYNRI